MRWRTELVLYVGVFALFGAVLLWLQDATLPITVLFGGAMLTLLAVLTWKVLHVPRVLVVGANSPDIERLDDALELAGYDVCRCAGPWNRPCPVFAGMPCPLGERPTAAIVFRMQGETGRMAPCGAAFRVPEVLVDEHLEAEPATIGSMTRMGADLGTDRLVGEMEKLLA